MKDFGEIKDRLIKHVERLEEEKVLEAANEALNAGMDPLQLLELLNEGMNRVGGLYEQKDYYIADLIMAGIIFKQVLELDQMIAHFKGRKNNRIGKVVLGTAKGDIHDIGKDIFRGMLEANGFEVIDIGVDAPKELFVKKTEEHQADIVGLSGVLTSTLDEMKEVVDAFKEAGLRDKVRIIVGANHLTEDAFRYIGADGFANDASVGAKLCREWMNGINVQGEAHHE